MASSNVSLMSSPAGGGGVPLTPRRTDPTGETAHWIACVAFRVCLDSALCLFALVSNTTNALIFSRMGLKDGVTSTLLALSISDGLIGLFGLVGGVSAAFQCLGPLRYRRTAYTLYNLILGPLNILNLSSTFSTMVLALVRCFGVAMPLRVKDVMTSRRQLLSILVLTVLGAAVTAYGLSFYRLTLWKDPISNATQLIITFTPGFSDRVRVMDQYRNAMFFVSFSTINVCLVVLIVALNRSSRFIAEAGAPASSSNDAETVKPSNAASSSYERAKRRQSHVIKTVVLISAVFTVTSFPLMVLSISRQTIPGFRQSGYLWRSFDILLMISISSAFLNTCLNIFIYLHCNTNYRKTFKSVFPWEVLVGREP